MPGVNPHDSCGTEAFYGVCGDGASESKWGELGLRAGGIYAVPSSPGPVIVVGAGLHQWPWETDIDKN